MQACYDAVALFPNSALLRLLYGKVLDRSGNEAEASRQYRQSAELNNTEAMVELASPMSSARASNGSREKRCGFWKNPPVWATPMP